MTRAKKTAGVGTDFGLELLFVFGEIEKHKPTDENDDGCENELSRHLNELPVEVLGLVAVMKERQALGKKKKKESETKHSEKIIHAAPYLVKRRMLLYCRNLKREKTGINRHHT